MKQHESMSIRQLEEVLGLTIKKDSENKVIAFLCMLSAYTEEDQFNVSFNAPSSSGKSYIPMEIAKLFPQKDVMEFGYCSPMSFAHEGGKYDKEKNRYVVDLSRKVLIFLDQPHSQLLANMRPLLSHDKKVLEMRITDKNQKAGLRTKTIHIIGYPSVIFCTAGLKIDEQESTRFFLLSPQIDQEKIRASIQETIKFAGDRDSYVDELEQNPLRKALKARVQAIRDEKVQQVNIGDQKAIEQRFLEKRPFLKARHQRDIKRLLSLIKAHALLNMWDRERLGDTVVANSEDIEAGFQLWEGVSQSQELNIPPHVYNIYKDVLVPEWLSINIADIGNVIGRGKRLALGITRKQLATAYYKKYKHPLDNYKLRQDIIPMLEMAGLIQQDSDPEDKRRTLICPTSFEALHEHKNSVEKDRVDQILN